MNTNSLNSASLNALGPLLQQPAFSDLTGSISVSGYKWTTSGLYNAQNQYVARPYIQAQVIDQTLLVNQQMINNNAGIQTKGIDADACLAPDGNILIVAYDTNGDLRFGKITDGNTLSQWNNILNASSGTVLVSNGSWTPFNPNFGGYNGFHFNASIGCSNWVNGTYVIDVFYCLTSGGHFEIGKVRSTNGGTTWASDSLADTGVLSTSKLPFSFAAGKPVYVPSTGNVSSTVFYTFGAVPSLTSLNASRMKVGYAPTGNFGGVGWTQFGDQYFDSNDWIIHSMDAEYVNGNYYLVFSGYHLNLETTNWQSGTTITASTTQNSFFGNYGLYSMVVQQPTLVNAASAPTYITTEPREIQTFNSSSNANLNQCLYPGINYDGTYLWVTFRGDFTSSVNESGTATTTSNYYLCKSKDFISFDYPVPITDTSGNNITSYTNGQGRYVFIGNQNNFYYFWGDNALWQYIQNNVTADVSGDIIGLQIQDQSGGTSSVSMTVANGSGKWAGPSPTGTNFAAIWKNGAANKNSKIYLKLGYYNASGVPETVPRNIFYIDDITQNVNATTNDLVITGRDWNKLLSITQTGFTYTYDGPDFYFDPFNNTSLGSWNQAAGIWIQFPDTVAGATQTYAVNDFVPYTTYGVNNSAPGSSSYALNGKTLAVLSGYPIRRPTVTLAVDVLLPASASTGQIVNIYPFYIASNNYTRVEIQAQGANTTLKVFQLNPYETVEQQCGGTITSTGAIFSAMYTVYINMYQYGTELDISVGQTQNNLFGFNFSVSGLIGHFPATQNPYQFSNGQLGSIAIGTDGSWGGPSSSATPFAKFANLKFAQYTYSQTVGELTRRLATKAHIFDYIEEADVTQDLYDTTQWNSSGTFSLHNREINLYYGSFAVQNNLQIADGQVEFDAQVSSVAANNLGFDFVFRCQSASSLADTMKIRIMNSFLNGVPVVKCSLNESLSSIGPYVDYRLFSTINPDNTFVNTYTGLNNLEVDLTQWNHYTIAFNKGWIYVFINSNMVFAWYDNNYTTQLTNGFWGFSTVNPGSGVTGYDNAFDSNETLFVRNIKWPTFWQQNPSFGLNPGDDLTSAIRQNLQTVFGWAFSDLGGRMNLVVLKSTDPISYNYGDSATKYLLYSTSNDNSDKEYYNQVLVVGDGVSFLATQNTSVGTNGILRSEVIVDFTITTIQAATTRANQELLSIQKFGAQPAPQLNINVGTEVFDVVNIVDQSTNNTTNLNGNYRLYTQSFNIDNQSHYSVTLGTGTVTSNS